MDEKRKPKFPHVQTPHAEFKLIPEYRIRQFRQFIEECRKMEARNGILAQSLYAQNMTEVLEENDYLRNLIAILRPEMGEP